MSLMYCHNCKQMYGPTTPCPTCGRWGERVEVKPPEKDLTRYNELRREFEKKHEHADEIVCDVKTGRPVKVIYYAPDPEANYAEVDALISEVEGNNE